MRRCSCALRRIVSASVIARSVGCRAGTGHGQTETRFPARTGKLGTRQYNPLQMLRFLTAGESHGPQLTVIVEGMPAGVSLDAPRDIDPDLHRRQGGHGRGKRQQIEHDTARIVSGVRGGKTLGSPVTLVIENRDWENWKGPMQVEAPRLQVQTGHPRSPGSRRPRRRPEVRIRRRARRPRARERTRDRRTGGRRRCGPDAPRGDRRRRAFLRGPDRRHQRPACREHDVAWDAVERSPVRCADDDASAQMVAAIDAARERGDTLGGTAYVDRRAMFRPDLAVTCTGTGGSTGSSRRRCAASRR